MSAPEYLQAIGDSSPDWGGPNRGIMDWKLEESDDGATLLRFRHALFRHAQEQTRASLEGGWKLLFEQCLKVYAETGERPAVADGDAPECSADS